MRPETKYAKSGNVSIAYQVVGDGSVDLILVPGFVSHVEVAWEEPNLAHFLSRLASFSRLIVFDKRGTGMSDPITSPPTMDERMDDIRAVMDAVGTTRAAIFRASEGSTLSILFAHRHPERAQALVLYGSWGRRLAAGDYPWGLRAEELEEFLARMEDAWATGEWWNREDRSPLDDERHRQWWARYLRMAASPAMAQAVIRMNTEMPFGISCRTCVCRRSSCTEPGTTGSTSATADTWPTISRGHVRRAPGDGSSGVGGGRRSGPCPGGDPPHRSQAPAEEEGVVRIRCAQSPRARDRAPRLPRRDRRRIAKHLFISERTVETHLASVYSKLGLRSKAELIRRAEELGF